MSNLYREQLNSLPKSQWNKIKLTEGIIESLFPKAEKLLSLHRGILEKIAKWSIKNDTLIDVFKNIDEWYEVYLEYWSNHENAYKLYKELLKKKNFVKIHTQLCKDFNWIGFDTLMISPIQRIPRYMLYLKDLIKHWYVGNIAYQTYFLSLENVKTLLCGINEQMKEIEKYIKPSVDLKKLSSQKHNLATKNWLAEFDMLLIKGDFKPNNKNKFKVIIFTDCLIVLNKKFFGYEIITYMEINQSFRILSLPNMKYYFNCVKVTNSEKSLIFMAVDNDVQKLFIQCLSDCLLEKHDIQESRHTSITGWNRDYIVSDIIYVEWQGKSSVYAIRVSGDNFSFSKMIFKSFSEILKLYERFSNNDEFKNCLPEFPKKKYLVSGATKMIEYRRLTLDYFMQNLLLSDKIQKSVFISQFFKVGDEKVVDPRLNNFEKQTIKIMLLNKQSIDTEIDKNTEASQVWDNIWEQLKISYSKDKRLFLIQRQRVLKVLDNSELVVKVI